MIAFVEGTVAALGTDSVVLDTGGVGYRVFCGPGTLAALRERFNIEKAVALTEYASWTPLASAARDAFGWPLVYDCMDDWATFPGGDRPELRKLEETLVASADRMVVSSHTIAERWDGKRPGTLLARNATDFEFFNQPGNDDPLPGVRGPIAGFFGAIPEWFDQALVKHVAQARPEVTFVFVGGVHRTSVKDLESLPNVIFEGFQPYEKMPLYLQRFDVCLVPFEVSPVTDGMDVVKLYEYLSQGKPVVTTRIREIVRIVQESGVGEVTIEDDIVVESSDGTPIVATLILPAGASREPGRGEPRLRSPEALASRPPSGNEVGGCVHEGVQRVAVPDVRREVEGVQDEIHGQAALEPHLLPAEERLRSRPPLGARPNR